LLDEVEIFHGRAKKEDIKGFGEKEDKCAKEYTVHRDHKDAQ